MRIAVVGTADVGSCAGACFADSGHEVACGRNVFEPRRMREPGFTYFGVGRST